jgi:multidrug efflux pump subunit AcrB
VTNSGRVQVGREFIAIEPTGAFDSVEDIGGLLISRPGATEQNYLRDVARLRRGYLEPPSRVLRYDGRAAIGLGISTAAGGNVVLMGDAIKEKVRALQDQIPLGVEIGVLSMQSDAVTVAIDGFVISLVEAVAIVVAILLLFMGLRSGLLIGFILVLTITATFIFMGPWNVALERISLGALIIALGMLVDNAIVVTDGMLVRIQGGQDGREAARDVVAQTSMPLLGATVVAIMAFASIGTSQDSSGEFCRSLFQVVFISLGLSWVTAVTVTPLLCVMFLKPPPPGAGPAGDPYGGAFYEAYRGFLRVCLRFRWPVVGVVGGMFCVSLWGFGFVDKSFFPDSTRPQFMVDAWLPQGTHIDVTSTQAREIEEYLAGLDGVTHVTTLVGGGAMRFLLTYTPEKANTAYVQFLVDVDDFEALPGLIERVDEEMPARFPDTLGYARRFIMGPGDGGKIQARFRGPDPARLRELSDRTIEIFETDGGAKAIRSDWRQRVKVIRPVLAEEEADLAGLTRPDVSRALLGAFQGETVGVYRERDELLPIVLHSPEEERGDVSSLGNLQVWSPIAQRMIPMRQVVADFETVFEDEIVMRLNRMRTITVHADPVTGPASRVLERVRPAVEALELPPGYELQWWGEFKSSGDAQAALATTIPGFIVAMVLIVIALFNSLRQPAIIWLCVPLALIGVTAGLLMTAQPFGFMALLGFLSLSGMLIKNAIVLIDEINAQLATGAVPYDAIVGSAVSRLRPVAMAASTTALGMIPLLVDAFFVAMAVTIIAGLMFATLLTMVFVPVLYAIFYRVPNPA